MYKTKNFNELRDNLANKIRQYVEAFKTSLSKELKIGDVAVTTGFVQFHTDGGDYSDPMNGIIKLDMTFLGAGALMLVLDFGKHNDLDRAYTLDLHTGKTGWIDKEALASYE